jgi:glycerol kinase
VRERTGLVLDPYFSGTKFEWLLRERHIPVGPDLALGTIDAWLIWNLTGGEVFATDVTNASRTMLFDIVDLDWTTSCATLFNVPDRAQPEVPCPSSGRFGITSDRCGARRDPRQRRGRRPAGGAVRPGLLHPRHGQEHLRHRQLRADERRTDLPPPVEGMLTTVAWELADGTVAYALEGAIFVTGAAVQWLRDGLGIIEQSPRSARWRRPSRTPAACSWCRPSPGSGAPWWDPYARGTIVGITRGTGRAHLARAVVESMAYQVRDAVDAMAAASGTGITELRVDGGASVMDLLLQMQADQLGVLVRRPVDQETTALGAAFLAGLAEGVWPDLDAITATWRLDATFEPADDRTVAELLHGQWTRAVERSRPGHASECERRSQQRVGDAGEHVEP